MRHWCCLTDFCLLTAHRRRGYWISFIFYTAPAVNSFLFQFFYRLINLPGCTHASFVYPVPRNEIWENLTRPQNSACLVILVGKYRMWTEMWRKYQNRCMSCSKWCTSIVLQKKIYFVLHVKIIPNDWFEKRAYWQWWHKWRDKFRWKMDCH